MSQTMRQSRQALLMSPKWQLCTITTKYDCPVLMLILNVYYKIWLPLDSNVGILMVQSYTSVGCTSLFKEQLENYFIRKGYKISSWSKCIPKEYI